MKALVFLSCLLVWGGSGYGQFIDRQSIFFKDDLTCYKRDGLMEIKADRPVSAVCFKMDDPGSYSGAFILSQSDTFFLEVNEHVEPDPLLTSNLVIFPEPIDHFLLYPGAMKDSAMLFLIPAEHAQYPGTAIPGKPEELTLKTLPTMVDQSVWRAGLPEPNYERIINRVRNVIIHHSATSNIVKDFTYTVRSIYLYHTQVNRWSDIGYNYLVAPTGVIYKGRDPGIYPQDEVLGAHFCAGNTGTLGICVIGTYMTAAPPPPAMQSLEHLIVWKLAKDHLDPLGISPHPLNPALNVIAGHRNGCSTLCPGDRLYADIPILRNRVHEAMLLLGTGPGLFAKHDSSDTMVQIYPNPARGFLVINSEDKIHEIRIINSFGQLAYQQSDPPAQISTSHLPSGWYIIHVSTSRQIFSKKIIIQ